jgi:hypothetical protein
MKKTINALAIVTAVLLFNLGSVFVSLLMADLWNRNLYWFSPWWVACLPMYWTGLRLMRYAMTGSFLPRGCL